jgi:hypothetical protein
MLNLLMLLQVFKQLEMLHHQHLNHQVMLVNKEVLVFQVSNQLKAAAVVVVVVVVGVVVVVDLHHHMNQVHFHHKVVLHSVMVVHKVIKATLLRLVVIVI